MATSNSGIDEIVAECVKKNLINDLRNVTNNFDRANLIRQSGFVLFQESIKDEDLASLVLEDVLDSYKVLVTSTGEDSVNNYTDRAKQLLKKSRRVIDVDKWTPVISKEDLKGKDILNKCSGKYEDCRYREITDNELKTWQRSHEIKPVKRTLDEVNVCGKEEPNNSAGLSIFEREPFPDILPDKIYIKHEKEKSNNDTVRNEDMQKTDATTLSDIGIASNTKTEERTVNENRRSLPQSIATSSSLVAPDYLFQQPSTSYNNKPRDFNKNVHIPRNLDKIEEKGIVSCEEKSTIVGNSFRTARDELSIQNLRKYGSNENPGNFLREPVQNQSGTSFGHSTNTVNQSHGNRPQFHQQQQPLFSYGASKKSLGARRTVQSKFIPPVRNNPDNSNAGHSLRQPNDESELLIGDERLKNIEPKMIELISSEIMTKFKPVSWDDIAGLNYAKATIQEAVVWPMLRPDIFTGLRRPPRGILLFGPPGTGKTLIGKCIASQSKSTFFSISASSLTSKWIGDGEKMVRALFAVAAVHQPSVIFIDEVDSLLCQRSETEHESSRRIKTEFLVQLDGAMTSEEERILIVGATNRPQELDEAARRRFTRRLYIPLPEQEARLQILSNLIQSVKHSLTETDIENIGKFTRGYSGADMESLCREASMEPIRSIPPEKILYFQENEVRSINFADFRQALSRIRASVSQNDLQHYVHWNEVYGSGISH